MSSEEKFKSNLDQYKTLINKSIDEYCKHINKLTTKNYGQHSLMVSKAFTDILQRDGKRIRGVLTIVGYEMCGGKDKEMIVNAARAVEMMHAYMLIIDDIQDRADIRRGGPSAHIAISRQHNFTKGEAAHSGIALALNSALLGAHGAELVLSNLDVSDELRLKALNIMNHTMMVTAHGQTNDIINELEDSISKDDIENVMQWKTAHYTVLNPIHMGMVLAGAPCEDTNAVTQYALNAGKAFQIADDLMVVSKNNQSGKEPINDIKEGKQTLLTYHALNNASKVDTQFLNTCLGKQDLTEEEYKKCQQILIDSKADKYAQEQAEKYLKVARESLHEHAHRWDKSSVAFLDELAKYLLKRKI